MTGISTRLWLCICALLLLFAAPVLAAPNVAPSPRVTAAVVVRAAPTGQSDALARLRPGEILPLQAEVPGWYRVTLPDGRTGYVSKAWTNVVPEIAVAAVPVWRIHFVDVGTGLATFVEGPDFTLVYDAGSNDDLALGPKNRFLAYLHHVRPDLQVIDHLILSHPHQDHVQLLPDLFDAYQIRNVWDSGRVNDICGYRSFLTKIQEEAGVIYHDAGPAGGSQTVTLPAKPSCGTHAAPFAASIPQGQSLARGLVVQLGANAKMTFLHADPTAYPDEVNRNSVPMRLDLGGTRFLFMGDAEAGKRKDLHSDPPRSNSIEGQLLACCAADIRANFLVAGHHGSLTSSRVPFLDAVGAGIFVISSGPKDYSGVVLPDPAIVTELRNRGELWRTDFDDPHCLTDTAKIGPDNDNEAGGCDNILVRVPATGPLLINYERIHD
jgi:competence protein ComEC